MRIGGLLFQVLALSFQWFSFFVGQTLSTQLQASLIVPKVKAYPFDTFDGALEAMRKVALTS